MNAPDAALPALVVVLGPTGVGKTATAVRLCRDFRGEIISADSRQIYRSMDIGTAKPSPQERAAAPHHLIDIVEPDQTLGLAEFQAMAAIAIAEVLDKGHVPFLVGGTGQWIRAIVQGWGVPQVPPDAQLRARLEDEANRAGAERLHARLAELDPAAAARIDHRNVRRVIRALEVYLKSGQPISALRRAGPPPYRLLQIGLTLPRELLYARVDERVERMMADGLLEEVRELIARGYGPEIPAMSGLGYRQIARHLSGRINLGEAVEQIKHQTHRFVRRQYAWFRLDDPAIHWFDLSVAGYPEIRRLVSEFLA